MACVTLKRSLEFDPLHQGAGSCSTRPHKRRRCLPMCVTPQSAAAASVRQIESQSAFLNKAPTLTPEQIAENLRLELRRMKRRKLLQGGDRSMDCEGGYESPPSPPSPSGASSLTVLPHSLNKDKPLFTFRQVNLICEQLVRETEVKIREEYEKVLNNKLAEQYDCFVRFTADQIQHRYSQASLPSYLS